MRTRKPTSVRELIQRVMDDQREPTAAATPLSRNPEDPGDTMPRSIITDPGILALVIVLLALIVLVRVLA